MKFVQQDVLAWSSSSENDERQLWQNESDVCVETSQLSHKLVERGNFRYREQHC